MLVRDSRELDRSKRLSKRSLELPRELHSSVEHFTSNLELAWSGGAGHRGAA
jgi:hypothetical protein